MNDKLWCRSRDVVGRRGETVREVLYSEGERGHAWLCAHRERHGGYERMVVRRRRVCRHVVEVGKREGADDGRQGRLAMVRIVLVLRCGFVYASMRVHGEVGGCGLSGVRHGDRGRGDGLGCARERQRLERRLGVDVHVTRVRGPARVEGGARATCVALMRKASVRVVGCGAREKRVVVGEEIGLGDGELEVENVEELTLDAADVTLAKDSCAERPVDVLESGVVKIL